WPEETPDYKYFYPTSMLETGYDILFFWVARMIMDGIHFTGKVPFTEIYLHGLVRDEHGDKMSKTKGNVVDPLIVMDELGTDALRFTLLVGSTPGNDTNLSVKKVEANRNFANKLWNAGRFVLGALDKAPAEADGEVQPTIADRWIWSRMQQVIADVERLFSTHQYGEAGRQIFDFFWGDYADWYIEIAKIQLAEGGNTAFHTARMLIRILDTCLRLLHPFTPFVTEALWGHVKEAAIDKGEAFAPANGWEDALIIAKWPEAEDFNDAEAVAHMEKTRELIRTIRNLRTERKVAPGKRIEAVISAGENAETFREMKRILTALAALDEESLQIVESVAEAPADMIATAVSGVEVYLKLHDQIDTEAEKARLNAELSEIKGQVDRLEKLLASPFAQKAPATVVEKERGRLAQFKETAASLEAQLANL
ncbi:MAG: class I tRNA ligase family protein, partial [Flexilinea sp.]|nr:class I tRNA ligase family protein [Flexilinea sp.]